MGSEWDIGHQHTHTHLHFPLCSVVTFSWVSLFLLTIRALSRHLHTDDPLVISRLDTTRAMAYIERDAIRRPSQGLSKPSPFSPIYLLSNRLLVGSLYCRVLFWPAT
uniref:Uncharacterized protein n=1 Tax=Trichobilharzia regenti TaxID=157069 RepID=A0AA85KAZ3_TRIRE|nr:unnamed protein product [Trichobilharzia regenti]